MFQSNNNALIEYVIFDKIKIIAKNYGINWSQNGNDKFWKYQSFKNTWNNSTFKYIYIHQFGENLLEEDPFARRSFV